MQIHMLLTKTMCVFVLGFYAAGAARPTELHTFRYIAIKSQTDKVQYTKVYEKYLNSIRHESLRLLEVGLGCDMTYGPGHSLEMWTRFLPRSEISFVEYDATCAEKYRQTIEKTGHGNLYVGDQANVTFLRTIINDQIARKFDVIIDDGGHSMEQQTTTILNLWELLLPGGIFVMEDLSTSYVKSYGGGPAGHPGTMIALHKDMIDGLNCDAQTNCTPVLQDLLDVDCFSGACVMVKNS